MTTKKNYYVCLRFKDRPELHMTVRYLKNLAPGDVADVIEICDAVLAGRKDYAPFVPVFDLVGWYGPSHTVRVLQARTREAALWPEWLGVLRMTLPTGQQDYDYHPHVSTKTDEKLKAEVIAVSLMCKKVEVARWDIG